MYVMRSRMMLTTILMETRLVVTLITVQRMLTADQLDTDKMVRVMYVIARRMVMIDSDTS